MVFLIKKNHLILAFTSIGRVFNFVFNFKVYPEKNSLKLIKNYSVQVNWFVYLVSNRERIHHAPP
jgi:hypothetical protein